MAVNSRRLSLWSMTAVLAASLLLLASIGCSLSPKERSNPLDPYNPLTHTDPFQLSLEIVDVTTDAGVTEKIRVTWLSLEHGRLDEHHVQRTQRGTDFNYISLAVTLVGDTTYLDTTCVLGTQYYYRVLAVFNGGADTVASNRISTVDALTGW